MTSPIRTAERMQSVANRILASQKPSASAVVAELRSILAEVEQAVPEQEQVRDTAHPRS